MALVRRNSTGKEEYPVTTIAREKEVAWQFGVGCRGCSTLPVHGRLSSFSLYI
jgi:hypothetical protein